MEIFLRVRKKIDFRLKKFSVTEKSGFQVKKGKGKVSLKNNGLMLSGFMASTPSSFISIGKLEVDYDTTLNQNTFFYSPFKLQINSLSANSEDIRLFAPNFPKLNDRINLRGDFNGTISNLKGHNINVNAGRLTSLETNFSIRGLPNLKDTYLYLDVQKLSTDIEDISKILSLNDKSESTNLPDSFYEMGSIEYKGNFTGFIDNLVAFGSFKTSLGIIHTDIGIKLTSNDKLVYSGFINAERFNVGKIINSQNNLNNVTMNVSVNGYKKGKSEFNSFIQGTIDSIDVKGYKYEKIELNGLLSNKRFDGKINLNDPTDSFTLTERLILAITYRSLILLPA